VKDHGLYKRLMALCTEEGDCKLWPGPFHNNGQPRVTVPGKQKQMLTRRVVYQALHGEIPEGKVLSPTCGQKRCLKCIEAMTVAEARALAASFGAYRNTARLRRATLTNRSRSRITETMVEQIKQAPSAKEASEQTGVSLAYVYQIREGYRRAPLVTPFAGLGA
jgi:hypothetical protein